MGPQGTKPGISLGIDADSPHRIPGSLAKLLAPE